MPWRDTVGSEYREKIQTISPTPAQLLNLPAHERAALAIALWESLPDSERSAALKLDPDARAKRDRRWTDCRARVGGSLA
jgi:hypothetical protein